MEMIKVRAFNWSRPGSPETKNGGMTFTTWLQYHTQAQARRALAHQLQAALSRSLARRSQYRDNSRHRVGLGL